MTPFSNISIHFIVEIIIYQYIIYLRIFKRLDENGDKKIDFPEFQQALQDHGIDCDVATQRECFEEMDLEGNGVVNFDEFLIALRV